nr:hypothetical protein LTR18_008142 [Exophiala xenobiotica]
MGRFQWIHGHPKQGGDKLHTVAHDWFSKDTAEPSRQALTEMMKDYTSSDSGVGGESSKSEGRSRTNTATSSVSQYTRSLSDGSNEYPSRPSSRQSYLEVGPPLTDRYESSAKSLLSRGTRILMRQGSKLNLLHLQLEEKSPDSSAGRVGENSPGKALQRQLTNSSKRTGMKRSISGPFAFQHLTHGDQAHFRNIDTVAKSELSSDFRIVQAVQQPEDHVRGIPTTDLPQNVELPVQPGSDEPTSPTTDSIPYLPITPPRPEPPPKDPLLSPSSPADVRLSRSMENFSRPTRLSVTPSDISPSSQLSEKLSALSPVSRNSTLGKPLPILPDVVHAVSTRDDIALPLRTAPLPSPPIIRMEAVLEEDKVESTLLPANDLRALTRQQKRRSQSSGELQLAAAYYNLTSTMTNVEASLDEPVADPESHPRPARRSPTMRPVRIQDWEDAIDYSWDLDADEDKSDSDATVERPDGSSIPQENYLVIGQTAVDEASSSASTPLMMQLPKTTYHPNLEPRVEGWSGAEPKEPSSPLLGLGIDPLQPVPNVFIAEPESTFVPQHAASRHSTEVYRPQILRSPFSSMSKSSSQESIILSIASSVVGTQRSSHSSTSFSDFAHLANFGDSLESLKLDHQETSPCGEHHNREGSQETIREEPATDYNDNGEAAYCSSGFPMDSPTLRHDRGSSAPSIPIPERKSSMPGGDPSRASGRRRAGTGNSRPRRNTRVSYSLFPVPPSH